MNLSTSVSAVEATLAIILLIRCEYVSSSHYAFCHGSSDDCLQVEAFAVDHHRYVWKSVSIAIVTLKNYKFPQVLCCSISYLSLEQHS